MAISAGSRLGPYEVLSPLGAGGMGEVWRARDGKLGREVAIKVLPARLSADPEALSRFEREARAVAALSHPNILSIFDFGRHGETVYAVMELLEGGTLRERLSSGALPARKAVEYSVQIAHGLAAAHERGIVHRDLKPENLFVTSDGRVKILDFGLAKEAEPAAAEGQTNTPTVASGTEPGTVMGTVGYMSPEQVRGRTADARSDLFSFGAILYEMLSGDRAFRGDSAVETMNAILTKDPPELEPEIPSGLERTVRHCLEKNPEERFRSARDLAFALEALSLFSAGRIGPLAASPEAGLGPRSRRLRWPAAAAFAAAAALLLAFGVAVGRLGRAPAPAPAPIRFGLPLAAGQRLAYGNQPVVAISRDGTRIAYRTSDEKTVRLYQKSSERFEAVPVAGTEDAEGAFFSPDGRWIGFFAGGALKKVRSEGGEAATICAAPNGRGGSWADDDTIFFASSPNSGLSRVASGGGSPKALTVPDAAKGENSHRWPQVLPGGKAVLFSAGSRVLWSKGWVAAVDLATGRRVNLIEGGVFPHYVSPGRLVFVRNGELMMVPFDPKALRVTGPAVALPERAVHEAYGGFSEFALSFSGCLAFVVADAASAGRTLAWADRQGVARPLPAQPRPYTSLRLSPDGKKAALRVAGDIWIYEIERDTLTRLTFDGTNDFPIWSPDGRTIAFVSFRSGSMNMYQKPADGSIAETALAASPQPRVASSFSPDGRTLVFTELDPVRKEDLWLLPLDGAQKPIPFLQTPYAESFAAFSPDGKWLAYDSDESGRHEVYIRPYPGPGGKWQISSEGGRWPRWRRDGQELFYWRDNKTMAVSVETKSGFSAGKPALLFEGAFAEIDVAPDGQRFLVIKESENRPVPRVNVVIGVLDRLRAPAGENTP